ncbi:hypothetical protein QYE76_002875 [Lolium multiflorum]|uniref:Reverse transcriptase domain-containing protein n=1 Tax=Lolium multiflorum TaxID=4521 RepID=A0AAD8VYB4_LOLMU|nr:hypothetical protein QYE76_002875 [Lolium multiflorum]
MPPWFIPAYFKKTQASKLGDAQGIPFFIDNIIRFHIGAGISGVAPHYIPPPSTFNVLLGSSWFDKPWFLSEGKLAAVRIIPSSWGSQRTCTSTRIRMQAEYMAPRLTDYDVLPDAGRSLKEPTFNTAKDSKEIRLKEDDEAKTAFITPYGVFCYKTMPFGLKNAGATYQRMMQKCLATQIGKNVQVYIDDVVITSKKGTTLIEDLKETFDNLDKFCLKLNPTKCSFGVPAENFSGS